VVVTLLAVAACGGLPDLLILSSVMRYGGDFTPALVILSMVGVWQGCHLLANAPLARTVWLAYTSVLAILSAVFGMLLAVSYRDYFQNYNPDLLNRLKAVFPSARVVLTSAMFLANGAALCFPLLGGKSQTSTRVDVPPRTTWRRVFCVVLFLLSSSLVLGLLSAFILKKLSGDP
jgi:hypothetical protein